MESKQNNYFQQPDEAFQQTTDGLPGLAAIPQATSSTAGPASPRRRKAPIDIDTALRLQSQASYVQEPARACATSVSSNTTKSVSQQASSPQATPSTTTGSSSQCLAGAAPQAASSPLPVSHYAPAAAAFANNNPNSRQSQPGSRSVTNSKRQAAFSCPCRNLDEATNYYYYDHYSYGGLMPQQSNISVDYIDCLSNNDLQQQPPPLPPHHRASFSAASPSVMKGIPQGRKHGPGRFHRAHRVEPSGLHHTSGAARPATASSSGDESPPNPEAPAKATGHGPTGGGTGGDSSSLLTSTNSTECSSFDQQQQQAAAFTPQSVLYPISVSEAKKRTYFIGSVSQDSLLGHDELLRYFPTGRVSIFVCTWNQNRKRAPLNLNDLLLPDQLVYVPDIYSVGIQEAYSSQADYLREWEIELQTTLGPSHVLLHSCSLGSLHLSLFIRRDLIWFCSQAEESLYNSRSMAANMIKTKGAVSIAFRFFGTSFMFTNCHFPAHENKLKDRIDEYQRIINSIDLPKNLKLLKPRYLSNDSTARFDCVFFMGDLNFRLEQRTFDETIQILDDIFQSKELSYEALTQNDELLKVMEAQQAFHGFDESQIKFPPTYKFLAQTNKYDRQTKRVPSYTDRILFRSKRRRHIQCLIYDWLPQLMSSDHKPVYSLFDVLIRPGHEQNMVSSLNAGLFQRPIYIEALKRRAEDPDGIRENGAGGNLICSIT